MQAIATSPAVHSVVAAPAEQPVAAIGAAALVGVAANDVIAAHTSNFIASAATDYHISPRGAAEYIRAVGTDDGGNPTLARELLAAGLGGESLS
jgi:hypothetical protein